MAKFIQAYQTYGPQVKLNKTVRVDTLADWISMRTSLNKSQVMMTLQELNEAVFFFAKEGSPVKLPGLGIFTPGIDRHGNYRVNVRVDKALRQGLNQPNVFGGRIENPGQIGLDNDGYKLLWDTEHPEDPLEI